MPKGKETVRVVRKAKVDRLKPVAGAAQEFDVKRCHVIPRASQESGGGWVQESGYTVYAPHNADIREDDQVWCRGVLHAVEGKPGLFPRKALIVTLETVTASG